MLRKINIGIKKLRIYGAKYILVENKGFEPSVIIWKGFMKKINFYVLYDMNDFPILYFPTLKEFCLALNYNYKYLCNKFSNFNDHVDLNIQGRNFKLYKFCD